MVVLAALLSRNGRRSATFLNFYVSHGSPVTFLRAGKNIIFILRIIHCCFQQWKNFKNWLTVDEKLDTTFLKIVYICTNSASAGCYQTILLSNRCARMSTTCPRLLCTQLWLGLNCNFWITTVTL